MKKVFAENLRYYTQIRGKTFTELAEAIGVGKSAVSNWLNGLSMPRMNKIDLICEFLQISRAELLESRISDAIIAALVPQRPTSTDKEIIAEYIDMGDDPQTIASYFLHENFSKEEMDEIKRYAEFLKSKRNELNN